MWHLHEACRVRICNRNFFNKHPLTMRKKLRSENGVVWRRHSAAFSICLVSCVCECVLRGILSIRMSEANGMMKSRLSSCSIVHLTKLLGTPRNWPIYSLLSSDSVLLTEVKRGRALRAHNECINNCHLHGDCWPTFLFASVFGVWRDFLNFVLPFYLKINFIW